MDKVRTTEQFISKSKDIHGDKYDYSLAEYELSNKKVKIICKKHGIFEQSPNAHLSKKGCSECYIPKKHTNSSILLKFKKVHGDKYDYSLISYINLNIKVKIICSIHGEFKQKPSKHLTGQGCPLCSDNIKKTTENFIKKSKQIHNNKYDYSKSEYIDAIHKVIIICPLHGEFLQIPRRHTKGCGCPECGLINQGLSRKSNNEEFIIKSKEIHGNKYDYSLVEYDKAILNVNIVCKKHGIFSQTPNSHLSGVGCPSCHLSKGEDKIMNFLDSKKIIYTKQHTFKECRNILPLKFDFYLPESNICIEYDGEQHFHRFHHEKNNDGLINRQKRDNIKTEYCIKNDIHLIRIHYKNLKKIDGILNECLIINI